MYKKIVFLFCLLATAICNAQYVETATNGLYYDPTSGTAARVVGLGGALIQNTTIDVGASYNLSLKKAGASYLDILNDGKIGIGLATPSEKLSILNGHLSISNDAYAYNTAMGTLKFSWANSTYAWAGLSGITNAGGLDQLDLAFYTAYGTPSEKMRIMSSTGFVGIGTSTPQTNLDINGNPWGLDWVSLQASGRMRLKSSSSPGMFLNDGTTDKAFIGYVSSFPDHAIAFYTPGTGGWAVNILQNGNLGIGTTAPSQKLDVNGNIYTSGKIGIGTSNISDANYRLFVETGIRTRKVKVDQATWPDYVFDTSYQLPSLRELETFIQQNKHLPDVPSADEVLKEGVNLGDNQAILLKKIEELTLYIIDINKKTELLMKENAILKEAILQND